MLRPLAIVLMVAVATPAGAELVAGKPLTDYLGLTFDIPPIAVMPPDVLFAGAQVTVVDVVAPSQLIDGPSSLFWLGIVLIAAAILGRNIEIV